MTDYFIQRARDIVADQYTAIEAKRTIPPKDQTAESWASHVESYAGFMRSGAYDNDLAVASTLAALKSSDLTSALLAVIDATRAYLPPDGIGEQECLNRIIGATDNQAINPFIRAADEARDAA